MPQSSSRLQRLFMSEGDDGITKAEAVIERHGGRCERGLICLKDAHIKLAPGERRDEVLQEFCDAIDFLIDEWDYGVITHPEVDDIVNRT